ncbi:MAG: lysostaphin resistance A-like protein [Halobacteriaceae archaeon]
MDIITELRESSDHPYILGLIFVFTLAVSTYVVYMVVQDWIATLFAVSIALFMFWLIYDAAREFQPQDKRELIGWLIDARRPSLRGLALACGVLLVTIVLRIGTAFIVTSTNTDTSGHRSVSGAAPSGVELMLFATLVIIVGPLVEELVFRGILQRFLTRQTGWVLAVILSSLVFAVGHVPSYGGFGTPLVALLIPVGTIFVDSTLWGWLYHRTGNVTVSFVAHGLTNGVAMLAWLL